MKYTYRTVHHYLHEYKFGNSVILQTNCEIQIRSLENCKLMRALMIHHFMFNVECRGSRGLRVHFQFPVPTFYSFSDEETSIGLDSLNGFIGRKAVCCRYFILIPKRMSNEMKRVEIGAMRILILVS